MPSRALLLVNPGARRGGEGLGELPGYLAELGIEPIQSGGDDPGRLPDLIARYGKAVDLVIVGGGDGTLNAAVQGLVGTGLPLGVLPLGTANNLARTLGIPTEVRDACGVIASGHRRRIDLGWVNGRYFFTTASLGLSVRITEELSGESKRHWGPLAYGFTALRVLTRARPFRADITWAGGRRLSRTVQIVVGNGRYYGSALTVAEDAAIDDARLDLYSIEMHHWWQLVALVPALKSGRHGEKRQVEALRATEFEIHTRRPRDIDVDGEIGTRTPARFQVLPAALEVFAPAPVPAAE